MIKSNAVLPTLFTATPFCKAILLGLLTCVSCASGLEITNVSQAPVDISLGENGKLFGQISDSTGRPVQSVRVDVRHDGQHLTQAVTDVHGRFVVERLKPGNYEILTAAGKSRARLWATNTAPPHAANQFRVNAYQVIRGQYASSFQEQGCACEQECTHQPAYYPQSDGFGTGYTPGYEEGVFGRFPALRAVGIVASVALPIALGGSDSGVTKVLSGSGTSGTGNGNGDNPGGS